MVNNPQPTNKNPKAGASWLSVLNFIMGILNAGLMYRLVIHDLGNNVLGHLVALGIFISLFVLTIIVMHIVTRGRIIAEWKEKRRKASHQENKDDV